MPLSPELLSILACPEDKGPLYYLEDLDVLFNPRLQRVYRVLDGIPVMLIERVRAALRPGRERGHPTDVPSPRRQSPRGEPLR
jgi:uncharacterized protein YbaR (Trm112 family)